MMPKTLEELYKRKIIVGVFNSTENFTIEKTTTTSLYSQNLYGLDVCP